MSPYIPRRIGNRGDIMKPFIIKDLKENKEFTVLATYGEFDYLAIDDKDKFIEIDITSTISIGFLHEGKDRYKFVRFLE